MSTKALVLGLLWVPLYFTGCKVRSGVDQSGFEIKSDEYGLFFVGHCTKIASECKSSCPQRDGVAETSSDLC